MQRLEPKHVHSHHNVHPVPEGDLQCKYSKVPDHLGLEPDCQDSPDEEEFGGAGTDMAGEFTVVAAVVKIRKSKGQRAREPKVSFCTAIHGMCGKQSCHGKCVEQATS